MLSKNNSKMKATGKRLSIRVFTFDLPAGHTCPMANLCHSRVVEENGRRVRKDYGEFVCYATKAETAYTSVYKARWSNFEQTKCADFTDKITAEIVASKADSIRIHSSGDFYSWEYFQKWIEVAKRLPHVQFWAYSKQASFVRWNRDNGPANFKMVYSHGGLMDEYATKHNLPQCYVVYDTDNLPAPLHCENHGNDDYEEILAGRSFSLMFH